MPRFKQSIGGGQRVVKNRIVGEVAHGKIIDPANRARMLNAGSIDTLDRDTAHKHSSTVMELRLPRGMQFYCYFAGTVLASLPCCVSTRKRL